MYIINIYIYIYIYNIYRCAFGYVRACVSVWLKAWMCRIFDQLPGQSWASALPKSADATTTENMRQKQQESRQAVGEMSEMVDCASKGTTSKAKFTVCAIAKLGAPLVLLRLVWLTLTNALINMDKGVDAVEYFAGMKAVTKGYLAAGYSCCSFEKNDAWDAQDSCSDNGFALAVLLALKVEPAGAALAAPVCSSWIVLNVGTSGRAPHRPLGNAWPTWAMPT